MWLVDPETREPLDAKQDEIEFLRRKLAWSLEPRWLIERDENGTPVRMHWYDPTYHPSPSTPTATP